MISEGNSEKTSMVLDGREDCLGHCWDTRGGGGGVKSVEAATENAELASIESQGMMDGLLYYISPQEANGTSG